ncbi:hypothetical protein L873DRAFT_1806390 [Choiromyces venosus 120613-1]|uniref:WD40 repeat-like protein n=1 Tax=Choiromyces venosus 120613-1 TaxID=1336337 RepID=A0A3N4JMZ3_9PEZI|nr:hypothetical protein L873DRAFT_1806390 [Choiromyces venosus 120613-1]
MPNPNVREIPGYYYDTEKGKYFKILPNHAGPSPSSSGPAFYTPSAIAQRESKRVKETPNDIANHEYPRARYRPSVMMSNSPYIHSTLDRELGIGNPISWRAAWKKLEVKKIVQKYKEFIPAANVRAGISNLFVQRMGGTIYFVVGMENGGILSFCANEVGAEGLGLGSDIRGFKARELWKWDMEQQMQRDGKTVEEGYLVKSDESVCCSDFRLPGMVTGTLALENAGRNLDVLVSSLSGSFARQMLRETEDFIPRLRDRSTVRNRFTENHTVADHRPTICMSHSPESQTICYGLEKGVSFGKANGRASLRGSINKLPTDIFATYALPPDAPSSHAGFAAGGRDGTVRLFDIRANPRTTASIVLKDVGSVRNIGGLGQTKMIVRSVNSCATYDIRVTDCLKAAGVTRCRGRSYPVPDGDGKKGGFDIYPELGLLAVEGGGTGIGTYGGGPSTERAVYLFDVESGDMLGKAPPGRVKFLLREKGFAWPAVVIAGEQGVGVYEW